jgi:hypothetical protein
MPIENKKEGEHMLPGVLIGLAVRAGFLMKNSCPQSRLNY